jgi:predicted ABC-class ATPase
VLAITSSKFELRWDRGVSNRQSDAMPDHERELFDQANTERLLRQIEKRLTHSREIISQIDMIRQLRFTAASPNPPQPRA